MGYFKKMKFDNQTIEFYNENAEKYSSYSYEHEKDELYQKFLNYLPKQGSILDAGCGAGWDTKFFLSNGYFVTALDASVKLLEVVETHKNLTKKIESDFLNFKSENIFDGIWASFSLQHLPKNDFKPALKLLKIIFQRQVFYIGIHEGNKEIRRYFWEGIIVTIVKVK